MEHKELRVVRSDLWLNPAYDEGLAGRPGISLGIFPARGNAALGVMEDHLKKTDWFVANKVSLADIALYAYTHCAEDGGFNLKAYPAVSAWLARVASTKNHVKMAPL